MCSDTDDPELRYENGGAKCTIDALIVLVLSSAKHCFPVVVAFPILSKAKEDFPLGMRDIRGLTAELRSCFSSSRPKIVDANMSARGILGSEELEFFCSRCFLDHHLNGRIEFDLSTKRFHVLWSPSRKA